MVLFALATLPAKADQAGEPPPLQVLRATGQPPPRPPTAHPATAETPPTSHRRPAPEPSATPPKPTPARLRPVACCACPYLLVARRPTNPPPTSAPRQDRPPSPAHNCTHVCRCTQRRARLREGPPCPSVICGYYAVRINGCGLKSSSESHVALSASGVSRRDSNSLIA